ncbi:hypothetical protein CGMCC3_g12414 [Colletotrichum fructicola]|nr:uncharacterized protein CGMCC3_g12414 [Colletotrichum fructicola]KAE9571500.1 hypothetical protein CGMCC3_g12414 [Colletotrichum fructicola]
MAAQGGETTIAFFLQRALARQSARKLSALHIMFVSSTSDPQRSLIVARSRLGALRNSPMER